MGIEEQLTGVLAKAVTDIDSADSVKEIEAIRVSYLGKKRGNHKYS